MNKDPEEVHHFISFPAWVPSYITTVFSVSRASIDRLECRSPMHTHGQRSFLLGCFWFFLVTCHWVFYRLMWSGWATIPTTWVHGDPGLAKSWGVTCGSSDYKTACLLSPVSSCLHTYTEHGAVPSDVWMCEKNVRAKNLGCKVR